MRGGGVRGGGVGWRGGVEEWAEGQVRGGGRGVPRRAESLASRELDGV